MSGNIEIGKCAFCQETSPVSRKYVRCLNRHFDDNRKGRYAMFVSYCDKCGIEPDKESVLLTELLAILSQHCGERGVDEGAVETLTRIIKEKKV